MHGMNIHGRNHGILVCDFGSQYTLLIARRLRELGYYAEVIGATDDAPPDDFQCKGIILSGGPDSTQDHDARQIPRWVFAADCPILGICYGMQLLVAQKGGELSAGHLREYGRSVLRWEQVENPQARLLLEDAPEAPCMWMSHGDAVSSLGPMFEVLAHSEDGAIAAVMHRSEPIVGLQFHPEVQHSEWGAGLLQNFVTKLCGMPQDWQPKDMLERCLHYVQQSLDEQDKVLFAVSGGVDSTVASAVIARAVGKDRLTCVLTDTGLLRQGEVDHVRHIFAQLDIPLTVLDESSRFFARLEGVDEPEAKRKIIGQTFVEGFEAFAHQHEGSYTHLGQGTLYPDVIESAGHGSGSKVIKSHHNVGGLPEKLHLKLMEPFRFFFKDEVRRVGRELNIPESILMRHPFPGPGLGIRIPGVVTAEKVAILQQADAIFIEALRREGLYDQVWQAATILLPVKSVGVMGDNRSYQWTCVLRAVCATDGMTADVSNLSMEFLTRVSDAIVRAVDGINRVLYDVTSKPPATIEWE